MKEDSNGRFYLGAIILIIGFCSPLLIPFVTGSDLSVAWKATLSGLLTLGIPEIFMVVAIAVMGKPGYDALKSKLGGILKPAEHVSRNRYRLGLVMFSLPLILGWTQPYLGYLFLELNQLSLHYYLIGDGVFFASFFVLGGNFWDKFSRLFSYS